MNSFTISTNLFLLTIFTLFSNTITHLTTHKDHFHSLHAKHKHIFDLTPVRDIWGRKDSGLNSQNEISNATLIKQSSRGVRLPLEVIPFHYFLEIIPILDADTGVGKQWTAPGNVRVLVEAVKPSKKITLHSLRLNISDVQAYSRTTGEKLTVLNHTQSEIRHDQYVIFLEKALKVGDKYEIFVTFIAPVSLTQPDGLYRSQYFDSSTGNLIYLVSTQLEFFQARQVFPCFDEPALKATFDVSIGRSGKYHSLSNSNMVSSVPMLGAKNWFIDTYNSTVTMPTYLVAFVVSDFNFSEADPSILRNRPVRVYGPNYLINRGGGVYGANVSARVLSFYENYFDSEYPMPKMDSAAVPGFLYGAMENYGLNIYREIFLMSIPGTTTEVQRYRVSSIIAHEVAHQWFGNLVTCSWWDNIWLNEGFATYYSYVGQNATNPEYFPMKQLLLEGLQYSMALDSREKTSYPLLLNAKTQDDIEHQSTGLPYYKGASLIMMMNGFLTPETFHKGIKRYLRAWAYKAAEQDDLFHALTEQAHEDGTLSKSMTVKEIMDPWTKQRGYPIVRVISSDNDTVYMLYEQFQSPYLLRNDQEHPIWPIPISIATQDDPNFGNHTPKFWIPQGSVVRTYKHDVTKWIVVNPDATGYYRVMYDRKLTRLLQKQLNMDHLVISEFSRSQILDDYFTLASQMDIPVSMALDFTKYLGDETEEICWSVLLKNLKRLFYFYSETENYFYKGSKSAPTNNFRGFKEYMVPRLEGVLEKIGFEQKSTEIGSNVIFRSRLLNWACRLGSTKCLDYAGRLFQSWKLDEKINPIPVDLRDFMYCYGVAAGGASNWLFAFERYANETRSRESYLLARSLGCVKDEAILKSVLASILNDKEGLLDKSSIDVLLHGVADNPMGRPVLMEFLRSNMKELKNQFNNSTFNSLVHGVFQEFSRYLHTEEELMEVQSIVELHSASLDTIRPELSLYIADISENINWMSKHYVPMQTWFDNQTRR